MHAPLITAEAAAEDAMALNPLRASAARCDLGTVVLTDQGPHQMLRTAARVRAGSGEELLVVIEQARGWFAERGEIGFTWWLGPSSSPAEALAVLRARSADREMTTFSATAMVLDHAPINMGAAIKIREVRTFEDYAVMMALSQQMADRPEAEQRAMQARLPAMWADSQRELGSRRGFVALIDGQPVSAGVLAITTSGHGLLAGSATARSFRGRGCYAALVARRWQVASELGLGALIVQASEMSAPILQRLGFRKTGELIASAEQAHT
jgi:GNAT superfamily N-acetyltransferase